MQVANDTEMFDHDFATVYNKLGREFKGALRQLVQAHLQYGGSSGAHASASTRSTSGADARVRFGNEKESIELGMDTDASGGIKVLPNKLEYVFHESAHSVSFNETPIRITPDEPLDDIERDHGDGKGYGVRIDARRPSIETSTFLETEGAHKVPRKTTHSTISCASRRPRAHRPSLDSAVLRRRTQLAKNVNQMIATEDDGTDVITGFKKMDSLLSRATTRPNLMGGFRWRVQRLLRTFQWDVFIASMIGTYLCFMGYQVNWAANNVGRPTPSAQYIVNVFYTATFAIEILLRLCAEDLLFFSLYNPVAHWNYLDLFIVVTTLVEAYFDIAEATSPDDPSEKGVLGGRQLHVLRAVKIVRVLKIIRIVRLIRFIRALRTLVNSILHTLKSVFWALVLMLMIIYAFGIILTTASTEYKENIGCNESPHVCDWWGDLTRSMFSLFKAATDGISWHEIVDPLVLHLSPVWAWVFLLYIVFVYFAVLNVITGVFCESAIESANADLDMVLHNQLEKKRKYVKKLSILFQWIDTDGSEELSLEELKAYMDTEMSGVFFEYLELEVESAEDVIRLIDADDSGYISKEEFIEGVCQLRGGATALQVAQLRTQIQELYKFMSWRFHNLQD